MTQASRFETVSTAILVVCAMAVTGMTVRRQFAAPPSPAGSVVPVEVLDWKKYDAGDMRTGSASAPVTIIEFSDFQCPFCKRLFQSIIRLEAKYPNEIRVVYRNYPLGVVHPQAKAAAIAAECAAAAGRFREYHDLLFRHQESLASIEWANFALRAGILDTTTFRRCLSDGRVLKRLLADSAAAAELHVRGTPTVLINKWAFAGAPPDSVLEQYVVRALAGNRE